MSDLLRLKVVQIDWVLFGAAATLSLLGLLTMASFTESDPFTGRQIELIALGVAAFFIDSIVDWRILRPSTV
ncbi:MAG: hypothetical protein WD850_01705, partial [Candidatus Spechtbacterales bacterium]